MGYDLKAKAINGGTNRVRGNQDPFFGLRPVITQQPEDWSGPENGTAVFTIAATSGDGSPLTYQWQINQGSGWVNAVDGGRISGATTTTFTIANISFGDAQAHVRCIVTNDSTSTQSDAVGFILTDVIYFLVTEPGDGMIDETAVNQIVDERSP